MKKIISALALILILMSACTGNETRLILDEVESYISERPDSALAVLRSIPAEQLKGREDNAKYALLYSMALDKNAIDVTSDSLISIATKWYANHGSQDERLKAYYYHGRVLQNARDNERAMEYFVEAEAFAAKASDDYAKGLLYNAMAVMYIRIHDIDKALICSQKSASCYKSLGNIEKYAGQLLNCCNFYIMSGNSDSAESKLNEVKSLWPDLNDARKSTYYQLALSNAEMADDKTRTAQLLDEYIETVDSGYVNWLSVSESNMFLFKYETALENLLMYKNQNQDFRQAPEYYIQASALYDSLGRHDLSLLAYKDYSSLRDSISLAIATDDTRFLEDRHQYEVTIMKKQNTILMISLSSLIILIVVLQVIYAIVRKLRRKEEERQRYLEEYSYLESERDSLKDMLESNYIMNEETQKVISARLDLLNEFFSSSIQSNSMKERAASREFDNLVDNTDKFLQDTRMVFTGIYPKFIDYLKGRGLTDSQLEICCLYALGLSGKDVINYTHRKRHYIENMDIRSKLGLEERGQNLGGYIQGLLKDLK